MPSKSLQLYSPTIMHPKWTVSDLRSNLFAQSWFKRAFSCAAHLLDHVTMWHHAQHAEKKETTVDEASIPTIFRSLPNHCPEAPYKPLLSHVWSTGCARIWTLQALFFAAQLAHETSVNRLQASPAFWWVWVQLPTCAFHLAASTCTSL